MKQVIKGYSPILLICLFILLSGIIGCDRSSSPEGRMSIQIEQLQKAMIDSLHQQNKAMLDSLGKIREDLQALKEVKK